MEQIQKLLEGTFIPNEFKDDPASAVEKLLLDKLNGWSEGPIIPYLVKLYRQSTNEVLSKIVISYLGLIIAMPEMFSQTGAEDALRDFLHHAATNELPNGLLEAMFQQHDEDTLLEILAALVGSLMAEIKATDLLGDYVTPLNSLLALVNIKEVALLLPKIPAWLPANLEAKNIANTSLLGTIFAVGIDFEMVKPFNSLVPDSERLTQAQWENASYTARSALSLLQSKVHAILYTMIKAGPEVRAAVMNWFWRVAELNSGRLKMRVDPRTITPDRVVMNAYGALLKFAEPFLPPSTNKLSLVDTLFPFKHRSDETRLNVDQSQHEEFLKGIEVKEQTNFVTECFFLCVSFLRLGPIRMINSTMNIVRDLRELQHGLEELLATNNPMRQLMATNMQQRKKMLIDGKLICDLWLQDGKQLEWTFMLVNFMMQLLMSLPHPHLCNYPEAMVEGIVEWCLYISRAHPIWWQQRQQELGPLTQFMMTFLDRGDLIRNPYLRSKFIDVLFSWAEDANLQTIFEQYPILVKEMTTKLQHFYVEAEATGASTQFYDKFNIRYQIAQVLKAVWSRPVYLTRIKQESRKDEFLHFVNFLVNDATFLLDESLAKLAEIHAKQMERERPEWQQLGEAEREEKEKELAQVERICQSYTFLGYETLHMLSFLTTEIKQPFMRPEVVDRLAAMLDANLLQLVGPKCSELRVRNPDQFKFYPKQWLCEIIRIYLNLADQTPFISAIARDHRSFSRPLFEKAIAILTRTNALSSLDIDSFSTLIDRVEQAGQQESQEALELGDIPDEFLDPLMFTLMQDPVKLATSNISVDRSTIVAHLLNDKHDPFNRMPLTMDQVHPDEELKERIQTFLKERRNQK